MTREEKIEALARNIEAAMPDEFPPGYARYLAERQIEQEESSR